MNVATAVFFSPGALHVYFTLLGGGFIYFYFHPYLGKISTLTNIFQMG